MTSLILDTTSRLLHPLLLLFSVFLLLTGHDEPGGGFVGGLVASAAFVLLVLSHGPAAARRSLRVDPRTLLATGLLLAAGVGATALPWGRPLLAAAWAVWPVPGLGELKVGTPLVFDVGVYLLVLGVTTLVVVSLAEEEGRSV